MAGPAMATRNSLQPGQPSEANDAAGAVLSSGDVVVKGLRIGLNQIRVPAATIVIFSILLHMARFHYSISPQGIRRAIR